MSIDELGRAAATNVRRNAAMTINTTCMLDRLHRRRRRRAAASVIAVLAATAAIISGGMVISHDEAGKRDNKPASPSTRSLTGMCANPDVRCIGVDRFRFVGLPVPLTVNVPATFGRAFSLGTGSIDGYRSDITTTGVSVSEMARPVRYDNSWTRDPAAGVTAASIARWLSQRPFLIHTSLTRTTVGGLPAWRVAGDLKPGAALPAAKEGGDIAPTFAFGTGYDSSWGYRANLTGAYTVLDLPGAGVAVIWSWTLNHSDQALAGNQAFIDGLSFG